MLKAYGLSNRIFAVLAMVLALGAWSADTKACDWVATGLIAYHFDDTRDYNETGPLIGCEINNYAVSYFKNSYHWDTFSLTKNIQFVQVWAVELGIEVGIVKGYRDEIPSFTKLLNADLLQGPIGNKAWNVLEQVSPWLTPRMAVNLSPRDRAVCYLLLDEGVACTYHYRI